MNISDKYRLKLTELTELFERNKKQYYSGEYDEANTRTDFIDKFFELLGWDIRNEQGYSEQYREVVREDKVRINGNVKAPDYAFRIGGVRKFFVEAKKPSVNIKDELEPAFQVRRYGYTAKLPLCILTNFAEFAVYDTRIKPSPSDKPDTARIFCRSYLEYHKYFDFIFNTFSKEAILKGSFDSYIQENKNKKGTSEVDKELLKLIENWRTDIAKNIALRNPSLNIYHLNTAVQKIIDRIIFLRIAEDKEMEEYGLLQKITESGSVYQKLQAVFDRANKKYNSGLFKPHDWLRSLIIDDGVLSSIINGLYYPECPYEFSILPVEILGNIYEQFLGKIIKFRNVKGGHTALIEEKPEVKKAGGVYYTPQYIVRYIVENTLGVKIKGQSPDAIAQLKVVDPACGSGSFLVEAYQQLLNYHLDYYSSEKQRKQALKNSRIYETGKNVYKLTIEEKQRILLNNIYGVDIDGQAVEVTKLSLYLKLLENEGSETKGKGQLFNFSDMKLLPSLDSNIKCGNSLVGSDYYNEKDVSLFDDEAMRKINTFDWDKEFPEVFAQGGFDCVIGNPPYVKEYTNRDCFEGLHSHPCYQGKMDLWYFFGYQGIVFLKDDGLIGFIAPNNWITNAGASIFRNFILNNARILQYVDFGNYKVFENASIQTMIYIMQKTKDAENYAVPYSRLDNEHAAVSEAIDFLTNDTKGVNTHFIARIEKAQCVDNYILFLNPKIAEVLHKIQSAGTTFFEKDELIQGIVAPQDFCNEKSAATLGNTALQGAGIFNITTEEYEALQLLPEEKTLVKPFYTSSELRRYFGNAKNTLWVIYTDSQFKNKTAMKPYPHLKAHLDRFAKVITSDNKPYGLHRARDEQFFKGEKIVSLRKTAEPCFTYTDFDCYVSQSYNVIKTTRFNLKFLTALLNSNVIKFWLRHKGKMQGDNFQVDKEPLLAIPLVLVSAEEQAPLISLADQMLETQGRLQQAPSDEDKNILEKRVAIIDKQIDQAVYQLYGLMEEEVKIVEGRKDVSDIEHIIISDQFPYNMAPWLNEKTENVINYVYNMQQILLSGYSDESGIDKFLSHRFPFDSFPYREYMKDLFSSCNFPSDREEISELLSNSFIDLTKIFSFAVAGNWELEDRDLLENQGIKGLEKLYKKYGLKWQANIQISNIILSDQFTCNMAHWLYERVVSVLEKLLEIHNFFVTDKQSIKELLASPYTDSKTNNDHILDLLSDSLSELMSILKFSFGKDLEAQTEYLVDIRGNRGNRGLDRLYVKYGIKSETNIHRDIFSFIRKARELLKGEQVPNRTFLYDILYPIAKEDPLLQHIDDNLELVRDGEMTWEVFVDKTVIDLNRLERLYENE